MAHSTRVSALDQDGTVHYMTRKKAEALCHENVLTKVGNGQYAAAGARDLVWQALKSDNVTVMQLAPRRGRKR